MKKDNKMFILSNHNGYISVSYDSLFSFRKSLLHSTFQTQRDFVKIDNLIIGFILLIWKIICVLSYSFIIYVFIMSKYVFDE